MPIKTVEAYPKPEDGELCNILDVYGDLSYGCSWTRWISWTILNFPDKEFLLRAVTANIFQMCLTDIAYFFNQFVSNVNPYTP